MYIYKQQTQLFCLLIWGRMERSIDFSFNIRSIFYQILYDEKMCSEQNVYLTIVWHVLDASVIIMYYSYSQRVKKKNGLTIHPTIQSHCLYIFYLPVIGCEGF